MTGTTWLITGASSGLGHALAEHVLEHDDRVALAVRNVDSVSDLLRKHPDHAVSVSLDVTDAGQREAAVAHVVDRFGSLDVLVDNAAVDYVGALEEQDDADIRHCFEVTFFGAVALTRLALPLMRRRRTGTIVNISSMDGIASLPGNGHVTPEQFPGDPVRAAAAIRDAVHSTTPPHRLVLGSDAHRRITTTLDELRAGLARNEDIAFSTDSPDAGEAVL